MRLSLMPSIENSFSHTRGEFNGRVQGSPGLAVNGSPWLCRVTRAPVMPLKSAKGSTSTPTPTAPQVARQFVRNPKKMSRRGATQRTVNAAILVLRTTGLPPRCLVVERICDPRATFHSVYEKTRPCRGAPAFERFWTFGSPTPRGLSTGRRGWFFLHLSSVAGVDRDQTLFASRVERKTAPRPVLRVIDQSSFQQIHLHVVEPRKQSCARSGVR